MRARFLLWQRHLLQSDTQCFADRAEKNNSESTERSKVPCWAFPPSRVKQLRTLPLLRCGDTRWSRWSRSGCQLPGGGAGRAQSVRRIVMLFCVLSQPVFGAIVLFFCPRHFLPLCVPCRHKNQNHGFSQLVSPLHTFPDLH